jgi:hypothetical protein
MRRIAASTNFQRLSWLGVAGFRAGVAISPQFLWLPLLENSGYEICLKCPVIEITENRDNAHRALLTELS